MRVPVFAVALCLAPALVSSQSLGDAARQQSRKRAKGPEAARVYTEADLRAGSDAPAAGAPEPPSATAEAEAGDPPAQASSTPVETDAEIRARLDREAEARRKREAAWRARVRTSRGRLERAQRQHDAACGPGVLVLAGG